jgi:hypothetical protein
MGDLFKLFIGLMLLAGVVNFFDFFNKYLRTPLSYFFQMIFIGGVIIWGISELFKKKKDK